jgi:hypothetical protein
MAQPGFAGRWCIGGARLLWPSARLSLIPTDLDDNLAKVTARFQVSERLARLLEARAS